jgi:hypothetical protein
MNKNIYIEKKARITFFLCCTNFILANGITPAATNDDRLVSACTPLTSTGKRNQIIAS